MADPPVVGEDALDSRRLVYRRWVHYQPPSVLVVAFNGHVFGLSPTNGAHLWEREVRGFYPRLQALHDRVLVLASGKLHCLALANGATLWEVALGFSDEATLLCDGTIAFVASLGEVATLLVADGRVLWRDAFKGKGNGEVALAVPGLAAQFDRVR
ncbi:MAG: PQQ-binding-like beta-propeller repeat protein [Deltaproteobacteria bacterium]